MFEMEASRAGLGRGWTEATASFVGRCDLSSSLRSEGVSLEFDLHASPPRVVCTQMSFVSDVCVAVRLGVSPR